MSPQLAAVVAAGLIGLLVGGLGGYATAGGHLAGLSRYRKTAVSVVGALLTWAVATFPTDPHVVRYGVPLVGLLTALGVYQVPNTSPAEEA